MVNVICPIFDGTEMSNTLEKIIAILVLSKVSNMKFLKKA